MEKKDIIHLLNKYQNGNCTEQEKALINSWYFQLNEDTAHPPVERMLEIGADVSGALPGKKPNKFRRGALMAAATAGVIIISLTLQLVYHKREPLVSNKRNDIIVPGRDKALLTLADGTEFDLDDAGTGKLASLQGIDIQKEASGQIAYKVNKEAQQDDAIKNDRITTPRGGTWKVCLPDGTLVWLNNSTSLSYPSSFAHKKVRSVILDGEAYFEVVRDPAQPFVIRSGLQAVKVLGTHFNITAYPEEKIISTTLLEGYVTVRNIINQRTAHLTPGKQSLFTADGTTVTEANMEQAVTWKKGYFRFDNTPIEQVMRELARWYDVDVRYEAALSGERLNGRISRSKNISDVLTALEATKTVHFKIEGRRITVMK